jgi:hypothetical protein
MQYPWYLLDLFNGWFNLRAGTELLANLVYLTSRVRKQAPLTWRAVSGALRLSNSPAMAKL